MWNLLDLPCPFDDFSEFPQNNSAIDNLRQFVTFLTTAADTLTSEHPLWMEMKVLQNIQARYKRILRCDKCLLYLHQIGQRVKKLVLLNLSRSYLDLAERFLVGLQSCTSVLHLPSRQQIEYILIRTQAAAKLICEAIKYSRETFCFLIQKLRVGHLILDLVMAASVTARINVMLKAILVELFGMYKKVLPWRNKLKEGSFNWSEELHLPQDLEKWLKATNTSILKSFPMAKTDFSFLSSLLKPKNENGENDADSVIVINSEIEDDSTFIDRVEGISNDYGEVIARKVSQKKSKITQSMKQLLYKIINVHTPKKLEGLWTEITSLYHDALPVKLTIKKKTGISNLLKRMNLSIERESLKNPQKRYKRQIVSECARKFAVRLGFTEDQMKNCKNYSSKSQTEHSVILQSLNTKVKPIRTLKRLRKLFDNLYNVSSQHKKIKLKKMYEQRLTDIKLLKENGENVIAKKLIYCTSKVLLTVYKN